MPLYSASHLYASALLIFVFSLPASPNTRELTSSPPGATVDKAMYNAICLGIQNGSLSFTFPAHTNMRKSCSRLL